MSSFVVGVKTEPYDDTAAPVVSAGYTAAAGWCDTDTVEP